MALDVACGFATPFATEDAKPQAASSATAENQDFFQENMQYDVQRKRVVKFNEERIFTHTSTSQFLVAHHMEAHAYRDGALGHRARERLQASDDFEELMLLGELDRAGRQRGVQVCTVSEALAYVKSLAGEAYL
jgi:hypothetical protein